MTSGDKPKKLTTVGVYLRALRAVFNSAIDEGEIDKELYPFGSDKKGKYQIPKTTGVKKALSSGELSRLRHAQPQTEGQQIALDFWLFSYACKGLNLADIARIRYADIKGDQLVFFRAKTINTTRHDMKPIKVHLTGLAKGIIEKYGRKPARPRDLIFTIIKDGATAKEKKIMVRDFTRRANWHLKKLAESLGITGDVSSIWARHSFSTNAIRKGASMEMVGEALGHSNVKTTQGYFAGFEDEAMKKLMEDLTDL